MAEGRTKGIQTTGSAEVARVLALLRQTRHVQRTVVVSATASKAFRLNANVSHNTLLVGLTLTLLDAAIVKAKFVRRTVSISAARYFFLESQEAADCWIALVVGRTGTGWLVVGGLAEGILTADFSKHTWVDALQTDATFVNGAVAVRTTASLALVVLTDLT